MAEIAIFALLNALRGDGRIDRLTMCFLMALMMHFYGYADWVCVLEWLLLLLAFSPGWSLAALNGVSRDWPDKFPPAQVEFIGNTYLYGVAGMAIRWLCFIPAISVIHGWSVILIGVGFAGAVGCVYYLSDVLCRYMGQPRYDDMLANYLAGGLLGLAL